MGILKTQEIAGPASQRDSPPPLADVKRYHGRRHRAEDQKHAAPAPLKVQTTEVYKGSQHTPKINHTQQKRQKIF